MLTGAPLTDATLQSAAAAALRDAHPQRDNAFKVQLAQRAIVRALKQAAGEPGGVA
jgi:xanthine dehydrogenase YagS FAD-binding subunit